MKTSDPSKIASIIKHFIGFPWDNASIAKYMNCEEQEGLADLVTYNPNGFSLEEKAFVLKLLSCIREKFGEIETIDEKEIKTSFGKTAYNYYLNIDGWKTNWAKETDPEKIKGEFANVSKRKGFGFFDKEKAVFLINNHNETIGDNLLPLLDETIGRAWIPEDIVKNPEDYIKKIYETEGIDWKNWFENNVMEKYRSRIVFNNFGTIEAIYLMRYIEYKEPTKELLDEIWKIAVDHFSDYPFLMYNLTMRIFHSKNYTASEVKNIWNELHQEKKIKTSRAFFALRDDFGRVIISDDELLKYYNEGGRYIKHRAHQEILHNRKYLKTKLGIQEIEIVSSIRESIEAIKWQEFYDEVRKIYKPTLGIEQSIEKFKEELKKTKYYLDTRDNSLSEKVREDSKKQYEKYKSQFDRNEIKRFLPIIIEIIEKSEKGYSDFFRDFSGVIDSNSLNNNQELAQSCKPQSFAIIGLREYLTIAKFFTDGGVFSCCPGMDASQKQMMTDSTMIYLNPMPVFEILGSSKDEEGFYESILEKYPVKNSYKEFEVEYKERIKGMADWFWKLNKKGYIYAMDKMTQEKIDFFKNLSKEMSIINYALSNGENIENSIKLVLEEIKPYLEEKINNKEIDPKQMFSDDFQKELEVKVFEIFEYFGLKEENCGYIGLKKQKQIIRVGNKEIEKETSNPSSSLRGKIDTMIKDLFNKYSHLCIKVEKSQNDKEDYLEY